MKPSLRKILADSHIASIAIAVLLFWSLDSAFWSLRGPISQVVGFLFTALWMLDIPYFSRTITTTDRFTLFITSSSLCYSLVYFGAAVLLSRWVYGVGPLRSLSKYRARLARRSHV
jgi:hypothetical protein